MEILYNIYYNDLMLCDCDCDSIRIGKYMGFGSVKLGRRAMFMGLVLSIMVVSICIIVLLSLKDMIPYIWISSDNEQVGNLTSNISYFVCLRELFYNLFIALSNILLIRKQNMQQFLQSVIFVLLFRSFNIIVLF